MPYKRSYSFKDVWEELIQSSCFKDYCRANPVESAKLKELAEKKMAQLPYTMPVGIAKTHIGIVITYLLNTLSSAQTD